MATSLSLEFQEASEFKAASYLKSLNLIEQKRRMFQNIRVMECKLKGGSTSKVIITSNDGSVREYINTKAMEDIIAKSNEAKYHATEGESQLHQKDFIDKLGTYGDGPNINEVLQRH